MSDQRAAGLTGLLLAVVFLAGLACCAILPPWEGADETAHWSYIQELADTGRPASPGRDRLSADLDRYAGPSPYSDAAPFERTGHPTYRTAHDTHAKPDAHAPTHFAEGATPNWEAQHPPLYYAVLAPVYRATRTLTFRDGLFALRVASWTMAFAGLAVGALATLYAAPEWARRSAPFMAAWPLMAPQVFPALARLGNDSLCLLEAGVMWVLLLRLTHRMGRPATALALGVVLGLGLLTKAFFLPISLGAAAYLVFAGWRGGALGKGGLAAFLALAVAVALSAWWYVGQYQLTHDLTGGADFVNLQHRGGLIAGLDRNYSAFAVLRGFLALAATFAWTGTWSLARPPEIFILAPLLLVGIPIATWLVNLRKLPPLAWAPLFLVAPMLASLAYHVIAFVALTGRGASTPGYYLHILAAPLALAVALGWRKGLLLPALWACTGVFTAAAWLLELSMFSGCAAKLGDDPHFVFQGASCVLDGTQLAALAHPLWAGLAFAVALALLAAATWRALPGQLGARLKEPELTAL